MTGSAWQLVVIALAGGLAVPTARSAPPVAALAVSPAGQEVAAGSTAGIEVRSAAELTPLDPPVPKLEHIADLKFSPDGLYLAAAGGVPAEAGVVEIYSWPQRELVRSWDFAVDLVYAVDWSADSRSLAVAGFDGTAWQVSVQPPDEDFDRQWHPGHSRGLTAICLLPVDEGADTSPLAVTAGIDQTLRVIDLRTGEPVRTLHNHTAPVHAVAVRPGAESPAVVASISDDRTVRFWQPTIGRMMRFARLESVPLCLTWSSDGTRLVTGCADGAVRIIDPQTAALTRTESVENGPLLSIAAIPGSSAVFVGSHSGELRRVKLTEE